VLCAVAVLPAGCGSPLASFDGAPQPSKSAQHRGVGRSWMSPKARGQDLLYVSTGLPDGATYVYTYPKGQLVGGLSEAGYSYGLCSDVRGNVFITNQYAIYEYPHGGASASAVLTNPFGATVSCSVDSTTGDLAAVTAEGVVIFHPQSRHGWKLAKLFSLPYPRMTACGYDASGNLFLDGQSSSGYLVAELPKGKSDFKRTLLDKSFPPGNIQWDGKYVAIGDNLSLAIRRFKFSGTTGRQVGTTKLEGVDEFFQFWIQGATIVAPGSKSGQYVFAVWPYPAGGNPQKLVWQDRTDVATVSVAPPVR